MNETLQLLQEMNWFLKPVSNLFIYLFTSGKVILIIAFVLYLLISVLNALWMRELTHLGAKSSYGRGKVPILEQIFVILQSLGKSIANLVTKMPVLLGIFAFFMFISGISVVLGSIEGFVSEQVKNKEFRTIVKHLDKDYTIGEMKITDQVYNEFENQTTTKLQISYNGLNSNSFTPKNQAFTLKGNDIYFEVIVIDFKYSEVASGNYTSLTIPYSIYTNEIPVQQAIELNLLNEDGIPFYFELNDDDIYGLTPSDFKIRVKEILNYIDDKELARKAGVRILRKRAHQRVWKGYILNLNLDERGGMVLRNKYVTE